jgi:hypothetical protein
MSAYTDIIEQNPEHEAFSLVDVYEFLRKVTDHERALRAISLNNWNTTWLEQHLEARNVQV